MPDKSLFDIEKEVAQRLGSADGTTNLDFASSAYQEFRTESNEQYSLKTFFEKYCSFAGEYIKLKLSDKSKEKSIDSLKICGFSTTPENILAASIVTIILGVLTSIPLFIIGWKSMAFFVICVGLFLSYVVYSYPPFYALIITMKAQEESILAILYMTIYMRVNPVLENAIYFATQHLNGPLGKDLKQVLWMLDMQKAQTIEEATQNFMELWVLRNPDFVKAFLTLHSAIDQTEEKNREKILEKALTTILDSAFIKMKHYSYELKNPILILHTFGMMLPLIGLIAFPMLSIFMADSVRMDYLFFGYVVVLPALLFFLINRILSKRPGAFSFPDLTGNPFLPPKGKYLLIWKNKKYYIPVLKVAIVIGLIITLPGFWWVFKFTIPAVMALLKVDPNSIGGAEIPKGEYTMEAMFFTMMIPLGFSLIFVINFYFRSIQRLKVRNDVVEIEDDLDESLFQLGNQFTDEIPIEVGLKNYIQESQMLNLKKRSIFVFFKSVMDRIEDEGVTFINAIFDKTYGVIIRYPSILMQEIMWIVVEGTKKGAKTLYEIMTKISIYLTNTKKIKELIYDLLTETVTSINFQARFLSPFLASIVGSLTLIIVQTLYEMSRRLEYIMKMLSFGAQDSTKFFTDLINFTKIWPPTVFQILVGIYLIETVILLSILSSGVESGFDEVSRDITIAKNLFYAIIVYCVLIIIGIVSLQSLIQAGISSTGG